MAYPAVNAMLEHVLTCLDKHRSRYLNAGQIPPLFAAVQGPQGSGKTFLTGKLREALTHDPHCLSVAVFSLDDLYLPHTGLKEVAASHPENKLLSGRGQPGTHDTTLAKQVLRDLRDIQIGQTVALPSFDKSLHNGEGDRALDGPTVTGPLDIVILEGWCLGFYPVSLEETHERWGQPVRGLDDFFQRTKYRKEDILQINDKLRAYTDVWDYFEVFIQIKPISSHPYTYIYQWRLEQEHAMKARNGGKGMSDQDVERFVDRYIPGYVFFGDGPQTGVSLSQTQLDPPPWLGSGLTLVITETRKVEEVGHF